MKLLVIGSGGREHALSWKLSLSEKVEKVFVSPGNGGTALGKKIQNINLNSIDEIIDFAQKNFIHFTVIGPELPLSQGIVDEFRKKKLRVFGPTQSASMLESSKSYAKSFMIRHNIPTANFKLFHSADEAHAYIETNSKFPLVIKEDGLASGKGVVIAYNKNESHSAIKKMFLIKEQRILIEDFLEGEEASFIVMSDGKNILPLATSQDHKRLYEKDQGPNTGGMGAYSPAPIITKELHEEIMNRVIYPTIHGMQKDGIPFTGFLYAGLMINNSLKQRLNVLEFNCRMGDPETQPIIMRIKNDMVDIFDHAINHTLDQATIDWDKRVAVGIVLAAKEYPDSSVKNVKINHLPENEENCMIFHAGTKLNNNILEVSGGRVFCVTAISDDINSARNKAYSMIRKIEFEGCQYRNDIGWRALIK